MCFTITDPHILGMFITFSVALLSADLVSFLSGPLALTNSSVNHFSPASFTLQTNNTNTLAVVSKGTATEVNPLLAPWPGASLLCVCSVSAVCPCCELSDKCRGKSTVCQHRWCWNCGRSMSGES